MTDEEFEKIKLLKEQREPISQVTELDKLRAERAKSLKSIKIPLEDVSVREKKIIEKAPVTVAYKVNLSLEDRDFLQKYIYTLTKRTGKIHHMTEGLRDAIASLRENCPFELYSQPKR